MEESVEFLKGVVLVCVVIAQSWVLADMTIDALVRNERGLDRYGVESDNVPYPGLVAFGIYGVIGLSAKSENSLLPDDSGHSLPCRGSMDACSPEARNYTTAGMTD